MPDLLLQVTFVDGTTGDVDLRNFLKSPQAKGTVFESLRDPNGFSQVGVGMGAVHGPMAPISLPMPCTMRSRFTAVGLLNERKAEVTTSVE
jgi:hypothetical protein